MLLLVEWARIEIAKDSFAWNGEGHEFAEDVGDDSQEHHRHEDGLGLEVEDLL